MAAIDRVRASFQRLNQRMDFVDSFYLRFMESSPDVAALFSRVDMDHQAVMMRGSLELMLGSACQQDPAQSLRTLAEFHGPRGCGVPPSLYALWLNSLIVTVGVLDEQADDTLMDDWRRVLTPSIAYMQRCAAEESLPESKRAE